MVTEFYGIGDERVNRQAGKRSRASRRSPSSTNSGADTTAIATAAAPIEPGHPPIRRPHRLTARSVARPAFNGIIRLLMGWPPEKPELPPLLTKSIRDNKCVSIVLDVGDMWIWEIFLKPPVSKAVRNQFDKNYRIIAKT